jgi:hypothetical protein
MSFPICLAKDLIAVGWLVAVRDELDGPPT